MIYNGIPGVYEGLRQELEDTAVFQRLNTEYIPQQGSFASKAAREFLRSNDYHHFEDLPSDLKAKLSLGDVTIRQMLRCCLTTRPVRLKALNGGIS